MVALKRQLERGFTLVETLFALSVLILVAGIAGFSLSLRPGAVAAAASDLPSLVAEARALAASTGDGATLAFARAAST